MKTILVIDDNSQLCGVVCRALQAKGFRAIGVENAAMGIQFARKHQPSLIISDIRMPNGDAPQMMSTLSDNDTTASIPVILMTGDPENAGVKLGMQLGADACLFKPFTPEDLLSSVERTFLKRESKAPAAIHSISVELHQQKEASSRLSESLCWSPSLYRAFLSF